MDIEKIKNAAYGYVKDGLPVIPCKYKGKEPQLKGWPNQKDITKENIDSWISKHREINLGLPLGKNSGLIGIDVDGEKAKEYLQKISKGDLPDTWEFITPGGGYRYLYKLPDGLDTKKWFKKLEGEHSELAILTTGQSTILPPSIHPNGGTYKWSEGKDPESIEIANAPKWVLDLIKVDKTPDTKKEGKYTLGEMEKIQNQCRWVKHCKEDSMTLGHDEWFKLLTIINTCKNSEANVIEYSKDYPGYKEEETLKKLGYIKDKGYKPSKCYSIKSNYGKICKGCTLGVGSPATLGRIKSRDELERVGFYYDDEGKLKGLNGNMFAAHLLTEIKLLFTERGSFYMYKNNYWKNIDSNSLSRVCRGIVHDFVPNYWSPSLEKSYIAALKREAKRVEKLDADRDKINLENGIYDLDSNSLKSHTPKIISSVQLPIKYDEEAKYPEFQAFLEDVLENDKERIDVVQEMFGYCLTAETSAQKAFMLYGRGSNGKSLLAEILMNLVGKLNVSAVPLNELNNAFSRYQLVDKLLNLATENEVSEKGLDTTFFKSIVAGDAIQVEQKYEPGFMYNPICKLVFCLNNLPYSKDKSWGFQRRLIVIPFNKVFREDDQNTQNYDELKDKLLSELDGIFIWAIEGLKRLRENKFKFSNSEAINKALEYYKEEVNSYYSFAKDKLDQGSDQDSITNESLASAFKEWANANGHKRLASASNQKIVKEVRNSLIDMKLDIEYGDSCKVGGKRCTKKIKIRSGEALTVKESD